MEENGEETEPTQRRSFVFPLLFLLRLLHIAKLWLGDGTFDLVQQPMEMLYTITAPFKHNGNIILLPFVFSIMTHKATQDYISLFEAIVSSFRKEWGPPLVEEFLLDHEKAVWNAARKVFGRRIKLRSCTFHWCQCIQERFKLERLTDGKTTAEETRICRLLLALPYMPHKKIEAAFKTISDQCTGRLKQVCNYMEAQWIAQDSAFPLALWSSCMQFIRTTNSLEGWHNRIQAHAERKKRLNFYKLVEII